MIRFFFVAFFLTFTIISYSQNNDADLEKGARLYNEMRDYSSTLSSNTVNDTSIGRLKDYIDKATPFLTGVINKGNPMQQRTARYFLANLSYELGFIYGMKGENYKAYDVLKKIESDYGFFSDSTHFPLTYLYNNQTYSIKFGNFALTLAEYYTGMGEICTNIKKYDEAVGFLNLSMGFSYTTSWYRYIAANKLWENKRHRGERDNGYLQWTLTSLQMCSRLDTSYQRTIRDNNYVTTLVLADTLDKLLQQFRAWEHKGEEYAIAASYLDTAGELNKAALFYTKALDHGLANKILLRKAVAFAKNTNNSLLENNAMVSLGKLYANEPDEVVRNLGIVLPRVVASANDVSKHLTDLGGRSMHSHFYSGDTHHSSIELPGALETFVTDFLKNNARNYYYWKSFIDQEKPANLQGRLKERYTAICNEIRSIYPNSPVSFDYNDPNRFNMKLNNSVNITVNYYYHAGGKDVILLSVEASYPK